MMKIKLDTIRRNYGSVCLDQSNLDSDPISQFKLWLAEWIDVEQQDPTAMVDSNVEEINRGNCVCSGAQCSDYPSRRFKCCVNEAPTTNSTSPNERREFLCKRRMQRIFESF